MTGPTKLLTRGDSNAKLAKSAGLGYLGCIMHLAPAGLVGGDRSVCPHASPGCASMCLNTAGRGASRGDLERAQLEDHKIHRARLARTDSFFENRQAFLRQLSHELTLLERRAWAHKALPCPRPCARLNGTSDLPWETFCFTQGDDKPLLNSIIGWHPTIQFYDYTKNYQRALAFGEKRWPANYHLTYSRDENSDYEDFDKPGALLRLGVNVAVVFRDSLPSVWRGWPVINGDKHDYRFLDPKGVIVGLVAKGRARHDSSGFVVDA